MKSPLDELQNCLGPCKNWGEGIGLQTFKELGDEMKAADLHLEKSSFEHHATSILGTRSLFGT